MAGWNDLKRGKDFHCTKFMQNQMKLILLMLKKVEKNYVALFQSMNLMMYTTWMKLVSSIV